MFSVGPAENNFDLLTTDEFQLNPWWQESKHSFRSGAGRSLGSGFEFSGCWSLAGSKGQGFDFLVRLQLQNELEANLFWDVDTWILKTIYPTDCLARSTNSGHLTLHPGQPPVNNPPAHLKFDLA